MIDRDLFFIALCPTMTAVVVFGPALMRGIGRCVTVGCGVLVKFCQVTDCARFFHAWQKLTSGMRR